MSIKVTVQTIIPSPSGLRFGLRVEHEKAGWVRFATTVLLVEQLRWEERQALIEWLEKTPAPHETDEPLFWSVVEDGEAWGR